MTQKTIDISKIEILMITLRVSNFRKYYGYHKLCRESQINRIFDHRKILFAQRHLNI